MIRASASDPARDPARSGIGEPGIECAGPPWILGWRGAPREAPENTLASFLRALDGGLDGLHYDLRACAGGDPVVLRDDTLERTTDGRGRLEDRTLSELYGLDAGGWFAKAFVGEGLPHLDEVLELERGAGGAPLHLIELHESELVRELARRAAEHHPPLSLRVASSGRATCLELRDAGLAPLLVAERAEEDDLAFVRDERLEGLAVRAPRGWSTPAGKLAWPAERWVLAVDSASDLAHVLRAGVHGITTSEGRRAQALRALFALTGGELEREPLTASTLEVSATAHARGGGDWRGEWSPRVRVANPFDFPCRLSLQLFVRRGAFEVEGLPCAFELGPGEEDTRAFVLRGGSWSPGGDPIVAALFEWDAAPERRAGHLLLDLSLRRERSVVADAITQRLEMLRESPTTEPASMTLRRRGARIALRVENPGRLREVHAVARLAGRWARGGPGLELELPADFDQLEGGVEFSCGFSGRRDGRGAEQLRRWGGGLLDEPGSGAPGRLLARRFA